MLPLLGDRRSERTGGRALGCHHSTANWWQSTQHRELVGASFHKTCSATAGKLADEESTETIKACGLPAQTPSLGMIRRAEIKIHASWWVCLLSICRKETGTFRAEGEPSAVMYCLQSHGLASPHVGADQDGTRRSCDVESVRTKAICFRKRARCAQTYVAPKAAICAHHGTRWLLCAPRWYAVRIRGLRRK